MTVEFNNWGLAWNGVFQDFESKFSWKIREEVEFHERLARRGGKNSGTGMFGHRAGDHVIELTETRC